VNLQSAFNSSGVIPVAQHADRGFLAGFRQVGEPYFAFLNIEDSIRRISLSENPFLPDNSKALPAIPNDGKERCRDRMLEVSCCNSRSHP
jgi:hypothetical protein